ncbi:hypothetical protein CNEO2_650005 [Clostridium neonatale]|nr:hypothetical protein CNEO2_650005 [Clostridium neonatale]CAI3242695.1 hypothetical protein CNEO2_430018 [Clostridium neonatale]CAI3611675.1 hypothetical protein CNEO2_1470018 [Clostridium neonatale]CAI3689976.1 hypothetical protein CNEO2_490018 [Clostridium neonatale]CAI3701599.1 hypothetical protein CNEO3_730023 [Clostridium neonatale]
MVQLFCKVEMIDTVLNGAVECRFKIILVEQKFLLIRRYIDYGSR